MISLKRLSKANAVLTKNPSMIRLLSTHVPSDTFKNRHIGPTQKNQQEMLKYLGFNSLKEFSEAVVPKQIRGDGAELSRLPAPLTESEVLADLSGLSKMNALFKTYIGMGYYGTKTPPMILRNMLENPQWYTAYTPYQAEISQGRLEMLLNFQTMVTSLTGMDISNCSLLDEGSAAGEALNMCAQLAPKDKKTFFVADDCHPQTIGCVQTRGENMGVKVVVGKAKDLLKSIPNGLCGVLIQYPNTFGCVTLEGSSENLSALSAKLKESGVKFVVATDLLACVRITPPGEFGADIVVGSAQRFGVPQFFGGPHAGFMAVHSNLVRSMPGRIIGVSKDAQNNRALRMALQTREQFIRREKATSNICTAQALLANVAAAYAIYHGPAGLANIAENCHGIASGIHRSALSLGFKPFFEKENFFDTVSFYHPTVSVGKIRDFCEGNQVNIRTFKYGNKEGFSISVDETISKNDAVHLMKVLAMAVESKKQVDVEDFSGMQSKTRRSEILTHPVFNAYTCETSMLRYLTSLETKDLSLRQGMIPLGSCTMKLNAAAELIPISFPEFSQLHPFVPKDQALGYLEMIKRLNSYLADITGFDAVSTQPNSGATGEYAGLLAIKGYHESRGDRHRNVCLIPQSAHGTNPASAAMCGLKIVGIQSDAEGNVSFDDLKEKCKAHAANLFGLMVTYPSTYGKYEERIGEICSLIHQHGGQVYMDGANMNAQLGLTSPGRIGADVCHLNLHKTFAIPHGGGGPGVGSIACKEHLAPFLPGHQVVNVSGEGKNVKIKATGAVAAAQYGSAGILPIPYAFIRMMGREGLLEASRVAMLNANYMAKRLEEGGAYKILYRGERGLCAHEFIIDLRYLKEYHLDEIDVAKRLADFGFHAPTVSWPVAHTMMVEPTESESKEECDRFCDAMLKIREEIEDVIKGRVKAEDSPLRHAPHTAKVIAADEWNRKYSRQVAIYPAGVDKVPLGVKYWPSVGRVDNVFGDRNLHCQCPTVEDMEKLNK